MHCNDGRQNVQPTLVEKTGLSKISIRKHFLLRYENIHTCIMSGQREGGGVWKSQR